MTLAPGQRFEYTIREETFTALADSYKESPCSQTRFRFDDGEIQVQCRMGLTMNATIVAQAQDCRIALQVLRGTPGFKRIVQELIASQFDAIQYDTICIEQVNVDGGEVYVAGQGR